jgi:ATP-dependent Clp protease ATP-binding subunit ClpC
MMEHQPNFTPRAQRAIEIAKKTAKELKSKSVSLEHLFLGVLHLKAGVVHEVLLSLGINPSNLAGAISAKLKNSNENGPSNVPYGTQFKQVLEIGSLISKNFGHDYVGIEHLLLAMLKYEGSPINKYFSSLNIPEDLIIEEIKNYFQLSAALSPPKDQGFQAFPIIPPQFLADPASSVHSKKPNKTSMMEKFTVNYNQLASDGKIDKIIGKEREISEVCEILCRRTKNNPVLLGEPGIGKTAIVEGLAQAIVGGAAPEHLLDKTIRSVDLAGMIAGTKYRGQFEERLKGLLEETQKDDKNILFIDEIHTLVGAGSAEGTMDAANILKPMLARGEVRCVGATTSAEYKKSILKDGALDRRFQSVRCAAPDERETLEILRGIKNKYEEFHFVSYSDESLKLIVDLAARYIPSRQFPDKAIDILDQTGAKVKIKSFVRPSKTKDMEQRLEGLINQEELLKKKGLDCSSVIEEQEALLNEYSGCLTRWADKNFRNNKAVRTRDILKTVAQITGVPTSELSKTDSQRFLKLESKLKTSIIGQDEAISSICRAILRSKSGLRSESKPVGSFLLLGQSGLGKTYTAKVISNKLLGKNSEIIHIDMSEYSEKTSSTRLSGAAPGYVGYEEGSMLIDKISKNPYSVILFDEIEKAHPDVIQSLLQILEEGRLTDGLGRVGDFRNSIIIITGNIGSELTHKGPTIGFSTDVDDQEKVSEKLIEKASEILRPEFVNRLTDVIMYKPFSRASLSKILNLELKPVRSKLKDRNISLSLSKGCRDAILDNMEDSKFGARPISRIIQREIEDPLSELLISGDLKDGGRVTFCCRKNNIYLRTKEG